MYNFLHRISWLLSILLGIFVAYFICGFESRPSEAFLEFGWVIALIGVFFIKIFIFSEKRIKNTSNEIIILLARELRGQEVSLEINTLDTETSIELNQKTQEQKKEEPEAQIQEDSNTRDMLVDSEKNENLERGESKRTNTSISPENIQEITYIEEKMDETPNFLVSFFADRPLAKIGGLLLFLGALFFLSLIWEVIGPVGKILTGILFGLTLYGIGIFVDKKGSAIESRTLMGVGIIVNALTILSARWILGRDEPILSDTLTTAFLLLNTVLAVGTGLTYSSRTFLVFSYAFGYLIPFIVGGKADTPYSLLSYNFLLTISLFFLVLRGKLVFAPWLMRVGIVGSTLVAFFTSFLVGTREQSISFVVIVLLSAGLALYVDNKKTQKNFVLSILLAGYFSIFALLFDPNISLDGLLLGIALLFVATGWYAKNIFTEKNKEKPVENRGLQRNILILSGILLLPIFFSLGILFVGGIGYFSYVAVLMLVLYGFGAIFLFSIVGTLLQYVIILGLGIFFVLSAGYMSVQNIAISADDSLLVMSSGLIFFVLSAVLSIRYNRPKISLPSLIFFSLISILVLRSEWILSWIALGMYAVSTLIVPFFLAQLKISKSSIGPLSILLPFGLILGEIAYLGYGTLYVGGSLVMLGLIYLGTALVSLVYTLLLAPRIFVCSLENMGNLEEDQKGIFYAIFAIPLSIFSLSIAVVFADDPSVVATIWILESAILAFLYRIRSGFQLLLASCILLVIGASQVASFIDSVTRGEYMLLVPVGIIAGALIFGVRQLGERSTPMHVIYDIIHTIGMVLICGVVVQVVPSSIIGWSVLSSGIFLLILAEGYRGIASSVLRYFFLLLLIFVALYDFSRAQEVQTIYALIIQLAGVSGLLFAGYRIKGYTFGVSFIAFIAITAAYVNSLSGNTFAATLYLTIVTTGLLLVGIRGDISKIRTIGLYLGVFVLTKILLFDIWYAVDNVTVRVLVLMVTGGLMIWLSSLYGKKIQRTWSEEFSWENFIS